MHSGQSSTGAFQGLNSPLNKRSEHVLNLVTEHYIKMAKPVASSHIASTMKVSSATVRNELAALEDNGYLAQLHTSSGRVPTSLAYRYYARQFIPPKRMPLRQQSMFRQTLDGIRGESFYQQLVRMSAKFSGYGVLLELPADNSLRALSIHLSLLTDARVLAVVVLETGLVRQVTLKIEPTPDNEALQSAERRLSSLKQPLAELPEVLEHHASNTEGDEAATFDALAQAWPRLNPPKLFSQGLSNLLAEPEGSDPDFMRRVVGHMEQPALSTFDGMEAFESAADFVTVQDAQEDNYFESDSVSIKHEDKLAFVSTALALRSSQANLVFLGPMRMRYPDVLMLAQGIGDIVSEKISFKN